MMVNQSTTTIGSNSSPPGHIDRLETVAQYEQALAKCHAATAAAEQDGGGDDNGNICVFSGASVGKSPIYVKAAQELGRGIAEAGFGMVYGGGDSGLMGASARAVYEAGGKVTGIYPHAMRLVCPMEFAHNIQVPDMHSRKLLMANKSKAFLVLPGGIGTLEEVMEMTTWSQLGVFHKFVGVLNVNGFYDHLEHQLDHCVQEGFLSPESRKLIVMCPTVPDLLDALHQFLARATTTTFEPYFQWDPQASRLRSV